MMDVVLLKKKMQSMYVVLWKKLTGWRLFLFYAVHYTLLFVVLAHFVFMPFSEAGKDFIWSGDGVEQHFMRLLYISRTLREGIRSLLSGDGWNIPVYDFHTGLTVQDLQIGAPQILAVFFPEDKIDVFYNIYVIMNYYLVGLSFSAFGLFFRQKPLSVMTGAVTYTFCGYAIFAGVRHPHFIVPMIFLPLLVIGAEKVLREEKAWLLLGTVFLSLTTQWGLYFSCMQAVFVMIYICVRFFDIYKEAKAQEFLKLLGRLAVWGGTGALLGGFVALPSFVSIAGTGRVGNNVVSFTNMLHYKKNYYQNFILDFMLITEELGGFFGCWVLLGFSVLSIPAILLLLLRHEKKERSLRCLFVIFTVMLCIPAVAYIMSGFSNISGRFCFGYAFLVSAILMFMIPHFAEMERSTMAVMGIALTVYFVVCYFAVTHKEEQMRSFVLLFAATMIFSCCNLAGIRGKRWICGCCLMISCFSVFYSSALRYRPDKGNYIKEFVNDPYKELDQGQYNSFAQSNVISEDTGFYRVTGNSILHHELGASSYYGLNGLSMYPYFGWSNGYIQWLEEMEVARSTNKHVIYDLNARSSLASLAGVKYYAERKTDTSFVPYGYSEVDTIRNHENEDLIWRNEHWLPLGYTYESYMNRQQYETLTALEKQGTQLQAVVLEEEPECLSLRNMDVGAVTSAVQIPYEVVDSGQVTWEDGKVAVNEAGGTITIAFTGIPKSETYLRIVNLDLTDGDSMQCWWLKAETENTSASAGFCADAFPYTHRQKTQMINMGYSEEGHHSITITFPSKGTFILDDIEIWCQPMERYAGQIDKLREETLRDVKIDWGGVTGTISASTDKFLCLSIPYMNGWKAYVDGEEVTLYQANTAFMGVELPAGEHVVSLRYWIPGLTAGLIMSGIGGVCFIAIIVFFRRRQL